MPLSSDITEIAERIYARHTGYWLDDRERRIVAMVLEVHPLPSLDNDAILTPMNDATYPQNDAILGQ